MLCAELVHCGKSANLLLEKNKMTEDNEYWDVMLGKLWSAWGPSLCREGGCVTEID